MSTNISTSSGKKVTVSSFADLHIVVTSGGESKLVTTSELADINSKDEYSYLDRDKEVLDSFKATDEGDWLEASGDDFEQMGIIKRTIFLESTFVSDDAQTMLKEKGYNFSWLANQGLMMSGVQCFGLSKVALIYLAKSLARDGASFRYTYPIVHDLKPVSEYAKNCISSIWVWDEEAAAAHGNADDPWVVHPELLRKHSYSDLTDDEEYAVMQYIENVKLKDSGLKVVTGFNMLYGRFRYCMVAPSFDLELGTGRLVSIKTGRKAEKFTSANTLETKAVSLWSASHMVRVGYPRFLESRSGHKPR